MTFDQWWERDKVYPASHDREYAIALAAWNAAIAEAREVALDVGRDAHEAAKKPDATTYIEGYQDAAVDIDDLLRELLGRVDG